MKHGGIKEIIRSKQAPGIIFKGPGFTKAVRQVELSDGKRGTVSEDGFEKIKKIDPDARLVTP